MCPGLGEGHALLPSTGHMRLCPIPPNPQADMTAPFAERVLGAGGGAADLGMVLLGTLAHCLDNAAAANCFQQIARWVGALAGTRACCATCLCSLLLRHTWPSSDRPAAACARRSPPASGPGWSAPAGWLCWSCRTRRSSSAAPTTPPTSLWTPGTRRRGARACWWSGGARATASTRRRRRVALRPSFWLPRCLPLTRRPCCVLC